MKKIIFILLIALAVVTGLELENQAKNEKAGGLPNVYSVELAGGLPNVYSITFELNV